MAASLGRYNANLLQRELTNMPDNLSTLLARRDELAQQQAALEREIAEARRAERQETIQKVLAVLEAAGLTAADLGKGQAVARGPKVGKKVAAKYRDPASGKTWSGRGIKPRWMSEAIATGKTAADFLIK